MFEEEMFTSQNWIRQMRLSTQLFINVLGFGFNLSGAVVYALLRAPLVSVFFLAMVLYSYQRIYHFMTFLDACECTLKDELGKENEN